MRGQALPGLGEDELHADDHEPELAVPEQHALKDAHKAILHYQEVASQAGEQQLEAPAMMV